MIACGAVWAGGSGNRPSAIQCEVCEVSHPRGTFPEVLCVLLSAAAKQLFRPVSALTSPLPVHCLHEHLTNTVLHLGPRSARE